MKHSDAGAMERDWWPAKRLIIVSASLAIWFQPALPSAASLSRLAEMGGAALLFSGHAAQLYLALFLTPLLLVVFLNDWLYDAASWLLDRLTGLREGPGLRWTALLLEFSAFVALTEILRAALSGI